MAEGARLEVVCGETHRGFKSHILRQPDQRQRMTGRFARARVPLANLSLGLVRDLAPEDGPDPRGSGDGQGCC